jgi:hypothetical protein
MHPCETHTDPAVAQSAAAAGSWTPAQRSAVIASFLAWVFDAFDFFLMVFVLQAVAAEFGTQITSVTVAIVLTLAMRRSGPSSSVVPRIATAGGNPCRRDRALFRSRAFVGLFAEPRLPDLRPRAFWHCDGWRLGGRCIAHNGNYPALGERDHLGSAAGRISYGVSHRRIGLRFSLSACRVARAVRDRRGAGIALHLCDAKRSGIDRLDGCARHETRERRGRTKGALATGDLRHPSDDRVQLL